MVVIRVGARTLAVLAMAFGLTVGLFVGALHPAELVLAAGRGAPAAASIAWGPELAGCRAGAEVQPRKPDAQQSESNGAEMHLPFALGCSLCLVYSASERCQSRTD